MIGGIFERSVQPSYLHLFIRGINDLSHQVLHYAWGIVSVSLLILAGFILFQSRLYPFTYQKFACSLMGAGLISLAFATTLYYAQILQTDEQMESLQGLMRTYLTNFTLSVLLIGEVRLLWAASHGSLQKEKTKKNCRTKSKIAKNKSLPPISIGGGLLFRTEVAQKSGLLLVNLNQTFFRCTHQRRDIFVITWCFHQT